MAGHMMPAAADGERKVIVPGIAHTGDDVSYATWTDDRVGSPANGAVEHSARLVVLGVPEEDDVALDVAGQGSDRRSNAGARKRALVHHVGSPFEVYQYVERGRRNRHARAAGGASALGSRLSALGFGAPLWRRPATRHPLSATQWPGFLRSDGRLARLIASRTHDRRTVPLPSSDQGTA